MDTFEEHVHDEDEVRAKDLSENREDFRSVMKLQN